jgi:hypothetical protein
MQSNRPKFTIGRNLAIGLLAAMAHAMPFKIVEGMSNWNAKWKGARRSRPKQRRSKEGSFFRGYYHKYTNAMTHPNTEANLKRMHNPTAKNRAKRERKGQTLNWQFN